MRPPLPSSIARSLRLAGGAAALAAATLAAVAEDPIRIEARPGGVVRWAAPATTECRTEGRAWPPIEDTCYFPIDLERTGEVAIERTRGGEIDRATVTIADYPYTVQRVTLEDDRHVDLAPADAARAGRERERIDALWPRETARRFTLPLRPPLARAVSQGSFGKKRIFNGQPRSPHTGEDYRASTGTAVMAVAPGVVAIAEEHFFGGRSVFLDHGDGLYSMYLHLSEIAVKPGQEVRAGDRIGLVGATGRASGPHLHFGLRWHGARVDPAILLASE